MPLTIEDGTNVADANSYVTRADVIAYAAARGVIIADVDATDVFITKAMDFIERQSFFGTATYGVPGIDQALQFPRMNIWYQGKFLDQLSIPPMLKKAECEAAMLYSQGIDLEPNRATTNQSVKSEKVGPLETEYFDPEFLAAYAPALRAYLRPLVNTGFALTSFRA